MTPKKQCLLDTIGLIVPMNSETVVAHIGPTQVQAAALKGLSRIRFFTLTKKLV